MDMLDLVFSSANALMETCSALLRQVDAKSELSALLFESKERVQRIHASLAQYRGWELDISISEGLLKQAREQFDTFNGEF